MENKIMTGLPYDMSLMNDIRDNGAIVNMNDLHFPNVDNQINVAMIFLRNTDFNVELDFSQCSYEMKSQYLLSYLTDAVEYKVDSLIQSWLASVCASLGIVLKDKGIFNEDELLKFTKDNIELVGQLLQFLISLPVYAVVRFKYENIEFNCKDIPINDSKLFNDNINYLLYNPAINIILNTETVFEPMNYIHYFTDNNNKLFAALQEHPYLAMLVAMVEKDPSEWSKFLNDYNTIIQGN